MQLQERENSDELGANSQEALISRAWHSNSSFMKGAALVSPHVRDPGE